MIEGQEDVTWGDWVAIAEACERSGIGTLFRSDHYYSVVDRAERGSLDALTTLGALAAVTEKLRLGTMVSPATFRHARGRGWPTGAVGVRGAVAWVASGTAPGRFGGGTACLGIAATEGTERDASVLAALGWPAQADDSPISTATAATHRKRRVAAVVFVVSCTLAGVSDAPAGGP